MMTIGILYLIFALLLQKLFQPGVVEPVKSLL